jgi:hypothetical protein
VVTLHGVFLFLEAQVVLLLVLVAQSISTTTIVWRNLCLTLASLLTLALPLEAVPPVAVAAPPVPVPAPPVAVCGAFAVAAPPVAAPPVPPLASALPPSETPPMALLSFAPPERELAAHRRRVEELEERFPFLQVEPD